MDYKYLKSEEHILMSVCAHTICSTNPSASLSLIGVGCGTLFMFLQNLFPESSCVGVTVDEDISNIGKKWFGLQCNEKFVLYDKIDYGKQTTFIQMLPFRLDEESFMIVYLIFWAWSIIIMLYREDSPIFIELTFLTSTQICLPSSPLFYKLNDNWRCKGCHITISLLLQL